MTWTLNNVATAPSAKLADGTVAYPGPNPAGAGAAGSSPNPAYQWVVIDVTIMNNGPVRPVDPVAGAQPVSPAQVSFQWVATPGNKVSSFTYADLPADNRVANALGVNTHTCLTGSSARLTPGQQASGEYTFSAPAGSGNLAITTTRGQPVAMLAIK